jgi:hypothetical protein
VYINIFARPGFQILRVLGSGEGNCTVLNAVTVIILSLSFL